MKTIQKLTLGLLTVVASSAAFASNLIIEVNSGSATVSGAIAGTAQKIGAGTAVMSGTNSSLTNLEINNGEIHAATAAPLGSAIDFKASASGTSAKLKILSGAGVAGTPNAVILPGFTMSNPATILAADNTEVRLADIDGGTAMLTLDADTPATSQDAGVHKLSADLSAQAVPMTVVSDATLKVGSSVKAPAAAVTMNGLLQLTAAPDAKAFQGAVTVGAAGTLQVNASVSVPTIDGLIGGAIPTSVADIFSNAVAGASANSQGLKFTSGATLKLGNAAVWARPITVGSFD